MRSSPSRTGPPKGKSAPIDGLLAFHVSPLASKGVGVRVLAKLAAHASISTTQRYIDVNDQQMRAVVELATT
jgi:integrase